MQVGFGKSVVVKGEITAAEDLVIGGRVEGTILLKEHVLTVLEGSEVHAGVIAKAVIVVGKIVGDVEALERLELREGSVVTGDVLAPRIAMADGAMVNGTVEMQKRAT
jgi:cytoskeletal protein CcmA (bactofilin family)